MIEPLNAYEKGIFEFFSKHENFENMLKVAGHVDLVKFRLLEIFWDKVEQEIRNLVGEKPYSVIRLEHIRSSAAKILIYDKNWPLTRNDLPLFAVGIERLGMSYPYYGIWLNPVNRQVNPETHDKIIAVIREKSVNSGLTFDNNKEWPVWRRTESLDFSKDDSFLRILPETAESDELVKSIATVLFRLMEKEISFLSDLTASKS